MKYPDCYGKLALKEPENMKEKGCIHCAQWNGCLTVTRITEGKGVEAGTEERKKEDLHGCSVRRLWVD